MVPNLMGKNGRACMNACMHWGMLMTNGLLGSACLGKHVLTLEQRHDRSVEQHGHVKGCMCQLQDLDIEGGVRAKPASGCASSGCLLLFKKVTMLVSSIRQVISAVFFVLQQASLDVLNPVLD